MRIPALTVLAFVASGCTIHVVEQPSTPLAARPAPMLLAAPRPARVIAASPSSRATPNASQRPATQAPSLPAARLSTTPVRTRPRPELAVRTEARGRLRFKDTQPEPSTAKMASAH